MRGKKIVLYVVLGLCTTVVNVVVYYLCYECGKVNNVLSTVVAWVGAVLFAFLTNKPLVFDSHSWAITLVLREGTRFFGCRIGTGLVEIALMYLLVDICRFDGTAMKLLVNVVVVVLNYVFSKHFVFNNNHYY